MFESHVPVPQNLQLKTCPFCSGEARLFVDFGRDGHDAYFAGCAGNGCIIRPITLTYATKRDAIRAWNWRGPQSSADPVIPMGGKLQVVKGGEDDTSR